MLYVIQMGWDEGGNTRRLDGVLMKALRDVDHLAVRSAEAFAGLFPDVLPGKETPRRQVLFAVNLARGGISVGFARIIAYISQHHHCLENCVGSVIVDGAEELFTKKAGREMIFIANRSGCGFPGAPLVEATGSLYNFNIRAKVQGIANQEAYDIANQTGDHGGQNTAKRLTKNAAYPVHSIIEERSNSLCHLISNQPLDTLAYALSYSHLHVLQKSLVTFLSEAMLDTDVEAFFPTRRER